MYPLFPSLTYKLGFNNDTSYFNEEIISQLLLYVRFYKLVFQKNVSHL